MTPSDQEHPDLEQLLDEAGDFCQARGPGWDSLLERLPERQPQGPREPQSQGTREPQPPPESQQTRESQPPPEPQKRRPRRAARWVWWAAAAVAASLLTALAVWQPWRGPDQPPCPPVARDDGRPPQAVKQPIALAAGCRVTPVGHVAYQVVNPNRVQLDCGEIFVEIDRRKAGNKPFVIQTPAGEARAVGTSFVVETGPLDIESQPRLAAANTSNTKSTQTMNARLPNITFLTKVLVLAGVVQLITAEATLQGGPGESLEAKNSRVVQAAYMAAPIFWAIRNPQVREELELEKEQLIQIGRIGAGFAKASREDWAGVIDLAPEQRQQKYQEIRRNEQRRLDLARKAIRDVLNAEQYDRLLMAQLRMRGVRVLHAEPAAEKMVIDEEQMRQIREKTGAMNQKLRVLYQQVQELRDQTFDDVMEALTPEQLRILKELEASGQSPLGPLQLQMLSVQTRSAAVRQPARVPPQKAPPQQVRPQLQRVQPQALRAQPNTRAAASLHNQKIQPRHQDTRAAAPQNQD